MRTSEVGAVMNVGKNGSGDVDSKRRSNDEVLMATMMQTALSLPSEWWWRWNAGKQQQVVHRYNPQGVGLEA